MAMPQRDGEPGVSESQTFQKDGLRLSLSEDGRTLLATYTPIEGNAKLDKATIDLAILERGFGKLFLLDAALKKLVSQAASAKESFTLEIGEVKDAEAKVDISPDKMAAYITVTPAFGGKAVNREQIMQSLAEKQVSYGVFLEEVERTLATGEAQKRMIAQGRKAENGEDGRLQALVDMAKERRPRFDRRDVADYRDLGGIASVRQGERIMQKIAPTAGQPGMDVQGKALPAKPGKACQFGAQLKGAQIDPQDPDYLIAAIAGQPVLVSNGMTVEPTLSLKTVDLASGNVSFEGSVSISGDVQPGMSVYASGDIQIGGTVEAASIEAGGNVTVKGGIIGHGEAHEKSKEDNKAAALVRCGGSCTALFIESATVEAGDSIVVEKLVRQSDLAAPNQIVVGHPGSGQGSIIGGFVRATVLVQAEVIGSPAGVKTRVAVGTNPFLSEKMNRVNKEIAQKTKELDDVGKILAFLSANPARSTPQIRAKAENTREQVMQDLDWARKEKDSLTQEMSLAEDAKIVIGKTVFGGVQIEIGGQVKPVDIERSAGVYLLKEGQIEFI